MLNEMPMWRRAVGLLSLIGAALLTVLTVLNVVSTPTVNIPTDVGTATSVIVSDGTPTDGASDFSQPVAQSDEGLPTAIPANLAQILTTPVAPVLREAAYDADARNRYDPFTYVPDRPRSSVEQYTVVQGDTVNGIAQRFGLRDESIVWTNDPRIAWILQPGMVLNIPPVDGVYIERTIGSRTIAEIAAEYGIDDPYVILASEYNPQLAAMTPETVPPSGTAVFIPGGVGVSIAWTPPVTVEENVSYNGVTGDYITFAAQEPGSCGPQLSGAGTVWVPPLTSFTWMRGFSATHYGVDLAAPEGTSVMAANGGTVIFRGWNNTGYGNLIVLSHGPYMTLYGHLSGFNIGCGQTISAGQIIGYVGTTGESTGPHLHFEVRNGFTPTDPSSVGAFGF
jgi:murein DD-endopeptidase MepM/ murein hydrolase activator NlpD